MNSLGSIAEDINAAAHHYEMGQFQELRQQIHDLQRVPSRRIFGDPKATRERERLDC